MKHHRRLISCRLLAAVLCLSGLGACASLPDSGPLIEQQAAGPARFDNVHGPLSAQKSAAILGELKRKSGDIDILERQMALEQAITDSPLTVGNKVTLLQNGVDTYAAMFAAMRSARDHINLESYIFEDDEIGQQFADLLLAQQGRGIQVNLIYDSVGGVGTPRAFFERLQQAGVAVLEFNPLNPLSARVPWTVNHRDHRKLLIVDGETAFMGGLNISSVYSSGSITGRFRRPKPPSDPAEWRDTHLKIEGPVVDEFQKLFLQTWAKQKGTPLAPRNYFPALQSQGQDMVRAIGSTPDEPFSRIYITLLSAIGNAEKEVFLTNAYFVPDPQLLKALIDAAARGVDVRLLLPSHSDSALVFHAGRAFYQTLLAGGVKIFERSGAVLHSKTAVVDGVWSTVGSTNLDWRSFRDNDEINAVVLGRGFAGQMQQMFNKDLAASVEIDLETWNRRSALLRFKEWMAQVWGRLL
jgi:cardiolipin synthase